MKGKNNPENRQVKPRPLFYIVMILLPVLFLVFLELTLRLFSYGIDTSPWIISNGHYSPNPDLAGRYFNNIKSFPATIEDKFDIARTDSSYRVFVLGGSSAAGFPYMPLGSFSRYIQQRLEQNYPAKNIEVVNLGIAAVNSYTILDLLPEVIDEKPDAILIYAGHNEYYGALGAGSVESYGRSRSLIKTILFLNRFKTFQLVKDFVNLFKSENIGRQPGTLMARMAGKKAIPYKSEIYFNGIEQFRQNLKEIIETCRDENIPLIIGTVASNGKDNPPFVSVSSQEFPAADEVYGNARLALKEKDQQKADSLFRLAKDLDALRFRAPSEINGVIVSLSKFYNVPVADIDSAFRSECEFNIIGNELMTDHLHPSLEGYQLMGKLFYETLYKNNLLPDQAPRYPFSIQDSITVKNFLISGLDLKIAGFIIEKIKNDYPFVSPEEKREPGNNFNPQSREEEIAYLAANREMKWSEAHIAVARYAELNKDIQTMLKHMDLLINQYPFTKEIYDITIDNLLKTANYNLAFPYLMKRYRLEKNSFLSKWIGTIYFQNNNYPEAVKYLTESLKENPNDTQNLYNLGAIYALDGNFEVARKFLDYCLKIDPDHAEAKSLLEQLN